VEIGEAREVFADPQHPYTRELLRSTISLSTTGLHYIPGAPPDLVDPPPACHFHPRCPSAMRICAERWPGPVHVPGGSRVQCWEASSRNGLTTLSEAEAAPLERQELSVADEA
jgi:peptide/nickel transport system ATP-binding protein